MADDNTTFMRPPSTAYLVMDEDGQLIRTLINRPNHAEEDARLVGGFVLACPVVADHRIAKAHP